MRRAYRGGGGRERRAKGRKREREREKVENNRVAQFISNAKQRGDRNRYEAVTLDAD